MSVKITPKSFILATFLCAFNTINIFAQSNDNVPMVGGDVDKHGCRPSAGYQWSSIKKECIRIFETGLRLNPKAKNLDQTVSAFVVFKSEVERDNVEIFVPNGKTSIILKKVKGAKVDTWKNIGYILKLNKGKYQLTNAKSVLLYESGEN